MSGVALITGAGSGIGRAVALTLLNAGWPVALTGRRGDALEETARLGGDASARAVVLPADVTRADAVRTLFDTVVARCGRLDLLFNNAGANAPAIPLEDLSFDAARRSGEAVTIDAAYVDTRLKDLAGSEDLARYVL